MYSIGSWLIGRLFRIISKDCRPGFTVGISPCKRQSLVVRSPNWNASHPCRHATERGRRERVSREVPRYIIREGRSSRRLGPCCNYSHADFCLFFPPPIFPGVQMAQLTAHESRRATEQDITAKTAKLHAGALGDVLNF